MKRNISIQQVGNPEFPRFVICDGEESWDGKKFVENCENPEHYADYESACKGLQDLYRAQYDGRPVQVMVAPVFIEVYADESIIPNDLADWLTKNASLFVNMTDGPYGALVLPHIDWSKMRYRSE